MINDAEATQQLKFKYIKNIKQFGQVQIQVRYYHSEMGPTIGYVLSGDQSQQQYNLPVDFFKQILQYLMSKGLVDVKGMKKQQENNALYNKTSFSPLPPLKNSFNQINSMPQVSGYNNHNYNYNNVISHLQGQFGNIPVHSNEQEFRIKGSQNPFAPPNMVPAQSSFYPQQSIIHQSGIVNNHKQEVQQQNHLSQPDYKLQRLKAVAKRQQRAKSISQGLNKVKRK